MEFVDRFNSTEEVAQAMRAAQVKGTDLIVAVDFTYSNIDNGERSFAGMNLCSGFTLACICNLCFSCFSFCFWGLVRLFV